MQFCKRYSLPIMSLALALGACSSNNNNETTTADTMAGTTGGMSTPGTTTSETIVPVVQPIEFVELVVNDEIPVGAALAEAGIEGIQQATGYGNSDSLNYILTSNQRVVVFTDEAEFVETFDIPMLATVSAQALTASNGVLAVLDSQGQLYVKLLDEELVNVITYSYPVTQEFAALTFGEDGEFGQDGEWLTVNRSGAKTLYTLEPDGDLGSIALDSRLTDYEIVGADVDGNLFVLSNTFQQQPQTNIFEIDSQGQMIAGWTLSNEDGLVPSALNVNITDEGIYEFVIAHEDALATVKLTEAPGGTEEPAASIDGY